MKEFTCKTGLKNEAESKLPKGPKSVSWLDRFNADFDRACEEARKTGHASTEFYAIRFNIFYNFNGKYFLDTGK